MSRRFGVQAILLLLSIGLLVGVHAQSSTTGNITGTVRDPQGGAVPKVEITVEAEGTGTSRTVTTNDDGFYNVPTLPPGRYTLTASPAGFKKAVASGLELHVNENKTVNIELQVGQVTETVTVTSEATLVETRSGEVSSLISEKQVAELPLNGRNYAQLALMVPGVSPVTQAGAGGAFASRGTGLNAGVDMSVNGNQSNSNMWTVDGVNNMDVGSNRTLLVFPSIDAIQEFRVERNSFSAEFGQAQGAVINLITKGGTNEFHGTLFEFYRNDSLNANNFFLNRAGQPRPQLKYNNFGGNFNGPIIKNRLFFFWSEEWRRERRGQVLSSRVPTIAEKSGDFSGVLTGPLPHRPGMTCTTPGPNPTDPGCFPGNRIPTNQLSPAGLAYVKLFPDPNAPGFQNWATSTLQPIDTRQDLIRADLTISDKANLMVRWINEKWTHGNREDLYIWKDDFSLVAGAHDLKFGALFSHNIKDEPGGGAGGGNQSLTIQGCGEQTGHCIGDLLLRDTVLLNYTEINQAEIADGRWRDYEFYANDTWKIHPRVTLTMGLRYSVFPPAWEQDNRISNFIPSLYNGVDFN
ncbi:MAG: carboxypeptidase regulatory-like domain-containing protein, partial [Pyrinomonadaceae bacterium]